MKNIEEVLTSAYPKHTASGMLQERLGQKAAEADAHRVRQREKRKKRRFLATGIGAATLGTLLFAPLLPHHTSLAQRIEQHFFLQRAAAKFTTVKELHIHSQYADMWIKGDDWYAEGIGWFKQYINGQYSSYTSRDKTFYKSDKKSSLYHMPGIYPYIEDFLKSRMFKNLYNVKVREIKGNNYHGRTLRWFVFNDLIEIGLDSNTGDVLLVREKTSGSVGSRETIFTQGMVPFFIQTKGIPADALHVVDASKQARYWQSEMRRPSTPLNFTGAEVRIHKVAQNQAGDVFIVWSFHSPAIQHVTVSLSSAQTIYRSYQDSLNSVRNIAPLQRLYLSCWTHVRGEKESPLILKVELLPPQQDTLAGLPSLLGFSLEPEKEVQAKTVALTPTPCEIAPRWLSVPLLKQREAASFRTAADAWQFERAKALVDALTSRDDTTPQERLATFGTLEAAAKQAVPPATGQRLRALIGRRRRAQWEKALREWERKPEVRR